MDFCPDPLLYQEASVPACIRSDDSATRLDTSQYSIKLQILSKFIYGRIDATVRTKWIPVRTRISLRQESQFKFNRPDASLPSSGRVCTWYGNCVFNFNCPDTCLLWSRRTHHRYGNYMLKINCPDGHPPWSRCVKALYGNYLQQPCNRSDDSVSPSGRGSQIGKIFSKNLRNSGRIVVRSDGLGTPSKRRPYILLDIEIENWKNSVLNSFRA
jgi:hypothetical protein